MPSTITHLFVSCDNCPANTTFYGVDERWAIHNARANGWTVDEGPEDRCPKCKPLNFRKKRERIIKHG